MRRFLSSLLAALLLTSASPDVEAAAGVFHPELLRAMDTLDRAQGIGCIRQIDLERKTVTAHTG